MEKGATDHRRNRFRAGEFSWDAGWGNSNKNWGKNHGGDRRGQKTVPARRLGRVGASSEIGNVPCAGGKETKETLQTNTEGDGEKTPVITSER